MRARHDQGFTLLEVVVASAIFAVLMAISLSILSTQAKLGQQQHARAFGAAQAQRVYDEIVSTLATSVYEPVGTWPAKSLLYSAAGDNFCRLKLYRINRNQPYTLTPPFALDIDFPTPTVVLGVVDATGAWLGKTATTTGRLIYGLDTNGDGVPEQTRVISDHVSRFSVTLRRPGLFEVDLELTRRTGDAEKNGTPLVEKSTTKGQCLCTEYDATYMR